MPKQAVNIDCEIIGNCTFEAKNEETKTLDFLKEIPKNQQWTQEKFSAYTTLGLYCVSL